MTNYSDKSKAYILDVTENLFKCDINELLTIANHIDLDISHNYNELNNSNQLKMRLLYDVMLAMQGDIKNIYKLMALGQKAK